MTAADLMDWLTGTPLAAFVVSYPWVWPIAETLHFCGLVLMAGTVGMFDLRLLGLGKGVPPAVLHHSLRWGVAGFGVSAVTGVMFISATPDQYFYNAAFMVKAAALVLLGGNALLFYSLEGRRVLALGPDDVAPLPAKLMAGVSLALLATIMCAGRMLTFFRPPF